MANPTAASRLGSVITRLGNFVQLGVDLHVAQRDHALRIREEFEAPILAGGLKGFSLFARPNDAQTERFRIQLFQTRRQRSRGIFLDQVKNAGEPRVISTILPFTSKPA